MCDKVGIVSKKTEGLNWMQQKMAELTNLEQQTGTLADAMKGADIFVGVSAPGIVTPEMVASMNRDAILLCHGKSGSRDHARYCKGCRCKGRWYRTQ